ncbi:hypothetical protein ACVWZR_002378 [Bradyrhizobium sp. i1.3.1]
MSSKDLIEFRRRPRCGQIEVVSTGRMVVSGSDRREKCEFPAERWDRFMQSPDWHGGDTRSPLKS